MTNMNHEKEQTQGSLKYKCPNCGAALDREDVFCYGCKSFLTADKKGLLSPELVTDEEIQGLIDASNRDEEKLNKTARGKVGNIFGSLMFLFFFIAAVAGVTAYFKIMFISIGFAIVFALLMAFVSPADAKTRLGYREIQAIVLRYMAAVECKNIYGSETTFEPDSAFSEVLLIKAAFCDMNYNRYQGNRLIEGTWKGYPFSAGHVRLTTSDQGDDFKKIYDGFCMSIDTDLVFPERISIFEKSAESLNEAVEGADPFYDRFEVKGVHEDVTEQFLTPRLREKISLTASQYAGELSIVLSLDGNVFIASSGGEEAFDDCTCAKKMRAEWREKLQFPLKVLECFLDA